MIYSCGDKLANTPKRRRLRCNNDNSNPLLILSIAPSPPSRAPHPPRRTSPFFTSSFQEALNLPSLPAFISKTLHVHSPVEMPCARCPSCQRGRDSRLAGTWILMPQWCLNHSKRDCGEETAVWRPLRSLVRDKGG